MRVVAILSEEIYGGYDEVKNAIINADELAPGADRKQFRNLRKKPGQTCREGERIKQSKFDSWNRPDV